MFLSHRVLYPACKDILAKVHVATWMRPTYEELLVTVESQHKEIATLKEENRNLKKEVEKLQKTVTEIVDSVKHLQGENRKLRNELRKYTNGNTPSGAMSPYMKKKLEETVEKYSKTPE